MTNGLLDREVRALRVLVADGRPDVRSALRLMLEQDPEILVSAEAANSAEMMQQVDRTRPDVVIVDCGLPGPRAAELLPAVRSICPRMWIVAMGARPEQRRPALSAGADAFVDKTEPTSKLLSVVRQGLAGHAQRGTGPSGRQDRAGGTTTGHPDEGQRGTHNPRSPGPCAAWRAAYMPDRETVEVNGSGLLRLEDLKSTARGAAELLLRNRASRMLLDCTEAVPDMKILDIFYLPECYKEAGVPASARIALVLPRERQASSFFKFYETVCRNNGFACKLFQNHRSAELWLA